MFLLKPRHGEYIILIELVHIVFKWQVISSKITDLSHSHGFYFFIFLLFRGR